MYEVTLRNTTMYMLKCVAADAGCDAPAKGTTLSGILTNQTSKASGTVEGLEPETEYDCYMITHGTACGNHIRVNTEPVLYLGASLWGCDIVTHANQMDDDDVSSRVAVSQIVDCFEIQSTIDPLLKYFKPLSIVKQGEKISFTYLEEVNYTYGIQTCTLNKAGTQLTDCKDVLNYGSEALFGLQILDTKAYIARPSAEDVLMCTILANGTFSDCAPTGPTGEEYVNLFASIDAMYIVRDNVTVCSIEANGTLSGCKLAYKMADTGGAYDIAIQGSRAYITNPGANTVSLCSINPDGSLSECTPTRIDFKSPETILVQGSTAYITSPFENEIRACSILETGEISYCTNEYTPVLGGIIDLVI